MITFGFPKGKFANHLKSGSLGRFLRLKMIPNLVPIILPCLFLAMMLWGCESGSSIKCSIKTFLTCRAKNDFEDIIFVDLKPFQPNFYGDCSKKLERFTITEVYLHAPVKVKAIARPKSKQNVISRLMLHDVRSHLLMLTM